MNVNYSIYIYICIFNTTTSTSKHCSVMIAITLLHGINTSEVDAQHLVTFLQPFREKGIKVLINDYFVVVVLV